MTKVLGVRCTQPIKGIGATYTLADRYVLLLLLYIWRFCCSCVFFYRGRRHMYTGGK